MRIAHLSDVHLLGRDRPDFDVRFVSLGRALDRERRVARFSRALAAAQSAGADHLVLTGDLTETGTASQFEALAEALDGLDANRVTLVPGNHDTYAAPDAWRRALEGPLSRFRSTSACEPGAVVDRGDVVFLPIDVACHQRIGRSAGELTAEAAVALARRLDDPWMRRRTVVLALHHPPFPHALGVWQWIDGLRGWDRLLALLERHDNACVMHGHMHEAMDRAVGGGAARVFGASAVVDDRDAPRVRLYDRVQSTYVASAPDPWRESTPQLAA